MLWQRLAGFVLKFRLPLLILLLLTTGIMGYYASKVELSYDFVRAIPTDNPKYEEYLSFKKQFGDDGNLLVIGVQSEHFFDKFFFDDYVTLQQQIRQEPGVEDILSIPAALNLVKNNQTHKLIVEPVFRTKAGSQHELDSLRDIFLSLPFYRGLLYNPSSRVYVMAVHINKEVLNSARRSKVVNNIQAAANAFGKRHGVEMHLSGLPLIRTQIGDKVKKELIFFLKISLLLTAVILFAFFRSAGAMILSMIVVVIGVIWSVGTIVLLGYKITLLTGLIPPLIVVIGIPNCVYFLNKYHFEYAEHGDKQKALLRMVQRMGIVTLFTNLTAAIGFGVFYFTNSAILKEFGIVAGLNIMFIFLISFIFLPSVLSYLPEPKTHHTSYLENRFLRGVLGFIELLVFRYRSFVYAVTGLLVIGAVGGMLRLNTVGHIVDDLPHSDKIYKDLKFFEKHMNGVMPLEIIVDTKKRNGVINLQTLEKIDNLSRRIASRKEFSRPLSLVEGIKFARQAYYNGDSSSYNVPNQFDISFLAPYMHMRESGTSGNNFTRLVASFTDSTRRLARLSVSMADVGTKVLPDLLNSLKPTVNELFDSTKYKVTFTGTSIIFLEGSRFIINGLLDSILLALVLILACMLYLFKSWRMLVISIVPNLIPLMVTAGVMGWAHVPIKPSTVLVFSIALGIAIDVTIRFLVNFKQELPHNNFDISVTVKNTIHDTGLSIIYTSLILFAGFMIFSFSGFDGTKALGWLTSLTLILAMLTNLTILPALLLWMEKALAKRARKDPDWKTVIEEEMRETGADG